jgi:hypothetical protein
MLPQRDEDCQRSSIQNNTWNCVGRRPSQSVFVLLTDSIREGFVLGYGFRVDVPIRFVRITEEFMRSLSCSVGFMRSRGCRRGLAVLICCVAMAGMGFVAKVAAQDGDWVVVHAEYGVRSRHVDVTDIVRRLLWDGRGSGRVPVTNQTMGGDPAVGADKTLHITAQNRRREERDFEYREGGWIDVGVFALRSERRDDDDWDRDRDRDRRRDDDDRGRSERLRIIRGYYGAQGQMVNITDMLQRMVRDGVLQVHVENESFGGDPAVGRDKVLIVVYVADGREQAASTKEGNTMRIP